MQEVHRRASQINPSTSGKPETAFSGNATDSFWAGPVRFAAITSRRPSKHFLTSSASSASHLLLPHDFSTILLLYSPPPLTIREYDVIRTSKTPWFIPFRFPSSSTPFYLRLRGKLFYTLRCLGILRTFDEYKVKYYGNAVWKTTDRSSDYICLVFILRYPSKVAYRPLHWTSDVSELPEESTHLTAKPTLILQHYWIHWRTLCDLSFHLQSFNHHQGTTKEPPKFHHWGTKPCRMFAFIPPNRIQQPRKSLNSNFYLIQSEDVGRYRPLFYGRINTAYAQSCNKYNACMRSIRQCCSSITSVNIIYKLPSGASLIFTP